MGAGPLVPPMFKMQIKKKGKMNMTNQLNNIDSASQKTSADLVVYQLVINTNHLRCDDHTQINSRLSIA